MLHYYLQCVPTGERHTVCPDRRETYSGPDRRETYIVSRQERETYSVSLQERDIQCVPSGERHTVYPYRRETYSVSLQDRDIQCVPTGEIYTVCPYRRETNRTALNLRYSCYVWPRWAESVLRNQQILNWFRNFPHFMEPRRSLPRLKILAACPCPGRHQSRPCCTPSQKPVWYYSTTFAWTFQVVCPQN